MPDNEKEASTTTATAAPSDAARGQAPQPAPAEKPPFDEQAFVAKWNQEHEKRVKKAVEDATTPLQKEIKRLQSIATLKELPEEQREVLADRGSFNTDAAELVKDKFNLPDDLVEDILAKGTYKKMVEYGEKMARVLGTMKKEERSIAKDILEEGKPANVSEIKGKTQATETVLGNGSVRAVAAHELATKDSIDKLWLEWEGKGVPNPYEEQYRKFLRTGTL